MEEKRLSPVREKLAGSCDRSCPICLRRGSTRAAMTTGLLSMWTERCARLAGAMKRSMAFEPTSRILDRVPSVSRGANAAPGRLI